MSPKDITAAAYDRLEHPKKCAPNDFWGQVRRTVNGKPVDQQQIDLIISSIKDSLNFQSKDILLDLCCGNGALSHYLFSSCAEFLGVDLSPPLIEVAHNNFEVLPKFQFVLNDVLSFLSTDPNPARFTKVLWYGAVQFLTAKECFEAFDLLYKKFSNVQTIYLGQIPDADRAETFYTTGIPQGALEDQNTSMGRWWTQEAFAQMAKVAGWKVKTHIMPSTFFSSYYRFEAIFTRY